MKLRQSKDTDPTLFLLGPLMAALLLYIGLYFFVVRPARAVWFIPNGIRVFALPDYHGLPAQFFAPAFYVDRALLRPRLWGGSRIWNVTGSGVVVTNAPVGKVGRKPRE